MENGDKESPVEFLCHVAHLRAATIGAEIPAHGECEFCVGRKSVMRSCSSRHDGLLAGKSMWRVGSDRSRFCRFSTIKVWWQGDAEVVVVEHEVPIGGGMNSEWGKSDRKKAYQPPRLTTINLRPEEAVLGHCKTSSSGGPVQSTCTFITMCASVGS